MHSITRNITVTLGVALLAVPAVEADIICWTGDSTQFWDNKNNWDNCAGQPVADFPRINDTAIIKADATLDCSVKGPAACKILKVEAGSRLLEIGHENGLGTLVVDDHAEIDGTVRILQSSTLDLAGTTTTIVNGEVVVWVDVIDNLGPTVCDPPADPVGTLKISANSTITGDGGLIYGRKCTGDEAPTRGIIKTGPGVRLTLETTYPGSPLVVVGFIDIQALLTNESAHVGTNQPADQLLLSTNDKNGNSGKWFCYDGDFRVKYLVQVSGSNDWDMTLAVPEAHLWFEAGSVATCLSGDFNVHDGVVDVDTDLCTSGSATVVSDGVSRPQIFIHYGNDGSFGGLCSALCGP